MKENRTEKRDYSFLRQLTVRISEPELIQLLDVLKDQGMELYQKDGDGFTLVLSGMEADKEASDVNAADANATQHCLYVSAADRDTAVQILQKAGLDRYISEAQVVSQGKSLVEEAEEEYLKRRKMRMMECLIVVVIALFYYLYKMSV